MLEISQIGKLMRMLKALSKYLTAEDFFLVSSHTHSCILLLCVSTADDAKAML